VCGPAPPPGRAAARATLARLWHLPGSDVCFFDDFFNFTLFFSYSSLARMKKNVMLSEMLEERVLF
jgi:hypothetical protein